uniref:Uncharacterized protein n=1 Tax=Paulinella chromatophora TaxID=39717 RepID=B1X5Q8_PAUCH|nr:hypothetical protein PCC_0867 [Paulinella chromatophora]ACB43277.1 hypothetical protein PCC_0867 [Paulinella chromatophora]
MTPNSLGIATGNWLAVISIVLAIFTILAFLIQWGFRFRLIGVTSFTVLLAISCWAFGISYAPRVHLKGAIIVPIVFDNGGNLVVAAIDKDFPSENIRATLDQLALNLKDSGRNSPNGLVHVRLREIHSAAKGLDQPIVIAEAVRNLNNGKIYILP